MVVVVVEVEEVVEEEESNLIAIMVEGRRKINLNRRGFFLFPFLFFFLILFPILPYFSFSFTGANELIGGIAIVGRIGREGD